MRESERCDIKEDVHRAKEVDVITLVKLVCVCSYGDVG
jgi:hypothetical protein